MIAKKWLLDYFVDRSVYILPHCLRAHCPLGVLARAYSAKAAPAIAASQARDIKVKEGQAQDATLAKSLALIYSDAAMIGELPPL